MNDSSIVPIEKGLDSQSEEELLSEWQKSNVSQKSRFNIISLDNTKLSKDGQSTNANFGSLSATKFDGDDAVSEILPAGFSFFVVKSRVQIVCNSYPTDQSVKQYPQYICKEVDPFEDIEVIDYLTKEIVARGPYKSLKEQYKLKYKVALYVYYKESMYRWLIGGKSTLGSWFGVSNEINELQRPYQLKLKSVTENQNSGIFWNDLEFELGDKMDVKLAVGLQRSLNNVKPIESKEISKPASEVPTQIEEMSIEGDEVPV